ncbi:MAG: NADH-quinone oxidoreductase subunit N, partial [Alphaproteobacteria bacterium]|nr:NADH-quinone oxidoreductase subunit N [Alphaproteobacteria bacterium]
MNLSADLLVLLPELTLALGAMALLLAGAIGGEKIASTVNWAAIAILLLAGVVTALGHDATAFHDAFVSDGFSRFGKLLILSGAALSILLAGEFFARITL